MFHFLRINKTNYIQNLHAKIKNTNILLQNYRFIYCSIPSADTFILWNKGTNCIRFVHSNAYMKGNEISFEAPPKLNQFGIACVEGISKRAFWNNTPDSVSFHILRLMIHFDVLSSRWCTRFSLHLIGACERFSFWSERDLFEQKNINEQLPNGIRCDWI